MGHTLYDDKGSTSSENEGSSSSRQIVVGCRDFVSPLSGSKLSPQKYRFSNIFFLYCSDSVKSKKYDLPTAASIQAMRRQQGPSSSYGPDDLFATEV